MSWCRSCSSASPGGRARTASNGSGLGLAIARALVEGSRRSHLVRARPARRRAFAFILRATEAALSYRIRRSLAGPGAAGRSTRAPRSGPSSLSITLEALLVDLELVDALRVVAVAHLQDAERAPGLGLHL